MVKAVTLREGKSEDVAGGHAELLKRRHRFERHAAWTAAHVAGDPMVHVISSAERALTSSRRTPHPLASFRDGDSIGVRKGDTFSCLETWGLIPAATEALRFLDFSDLLSVHLVDGLSKQSQKITCGAPSLFRRASIFREMTPLLLAHCHAQPGRNRGTTFTSKNAKRKR